MGWKQPLDGLIKEQRGFIESFHIGLEPKPIKPKRVREVRYYNPNDYVLISPAEIERQAKENLESMKDWKWREENVKANQWEGTL